MVRVRNAYRYRIGASEEGELELRLRVEGLKYLQTTAIDLSNELEPRMDTKFGSK